MVPMYISNGISQGVMPLVGYTYAAKRIERMKGALRFTAALSLAILCTMAALLCVFPGAVTGMFIEDGQTVAYGSAFLRGMALSIPLLAIDFLAVGVFQAVGQGFLSLVMAVMRKGILEIPALFILNKIWPLYGLSFAQLAAEIVMAIFGTTLLLRLIRRIELEARAR